MSAFRFFLIFLSLAALASNAAAATLFKPLTEAQATEVRSALEAMKKDARGPYLRIRWYCKDGSVLAPPGNPCKELGGGVQHAERNERALRLAQLQFDVGVILQSLTYDQFLDAADDYNFLKQLPLQKYLGEVDDGWILRKARYYRGARQIEDEEEQGQSFLEKLAADGAWLDHNFLLAKELAAVVPHKSMAPQAAAKIRNLAAEIAELDPSFQSLRIKIHSFPSADDAMAVRTQLAARNLPEQVKLKMTELHEQLQLFHDPARLASRMQTYRRRVPSAAAALAKINALLEKDQSREALEAISHLSEELRREIAKSNNGAANLARLDLILLLQDQAFTLAQKDGPKSGATRLERIASLNAYFELAFAAGLLTHRELESLREEITERHRTPRLTAKEYKSSVSYLARSLDWGRNTARRVFGPQYQRYLEVEPKTSGFLDALVRSSILLPLSAQLGSLNADADANLGQSHMLADQSVSQGVRGLNPGVAQGVLEIIERHDPAWLPDPNKIYVIPDTEADLRPMGGILTLDAGNLLSHAQLLARNLGIPNAAISPTLLPTLRVCEGKNVFFAVSPLGMVILKEVSRLTPSERELIEDRQETKIEKITLDTSRLKLNHAEPIILEKLRSSDSGVLVGPKAANLGQLWHHFPSRVAPGVALPFGMYYRHINRPHKSQRTLDSEIREAYQTARLMERQGRSEQEINDYMFPQLARFRRAIEEMEWVPESRQAVIQAMRQAFGDGGEKQGVFVRSDTNAEDLPQFSGAGLNLTVPHQRTIQDVLASVKRVWASPFSERAYLWRNRLLVNQEDIYASVLLLRSVPSDKSGVLITSGLELGRPTDVTVVAAEGVGGAVEGDSAETLIVHPKGLTKLLSQAKSPYRRLLDPKASGVQFVPSLHPDYLLTRDNVADLLATVAEWKKKIPPDQRDVIWDMEFGFVKDKLWLFQIRPFVGHRDERLLRKLESLDQGAAARARRPVSLQEGI